MLIFAVAGGLLCACILMFAKCYTSILYIVMPSSNSSTILLLYYDVAVPLCIAAMLLMLLYLNTFVPVVLLVSLSMFALPQPVKP